jgi:phage terminase large subunit-like protein
VAKRATAVKRKARSKVAPKAAVSVKSQALDSRAERVISFIERYLRVPEGKYVGQPVRLRDWQKDKLRQIYGSPTRQCIWSMGRKNGKTALIAMLVLTHLAGPESRRNAQIYSAAQSRDQAGIVFGLASKMVRMNDELNRMVVVRDSAKELFCPATGVRYKALSADATTAYGLSPSLVIHDELGQVRGPRSELYDALETAMGAQAEPMSLVISTQAPTDGDLLSKIIDSAITSGDPRRKAFLFTAPPEADPWAEATWRLANPALGDFLGLEEFRDLADVAQKLPAQEAAFRNLNLNQRVAAEDHFLAPAVWALNAGVPDLSVLERKPVFAGADLSATQDLTAIVAAAMDAHGVWHLRCWFFLPEDGLRERAHRDRVPYDVWRDQGFLLTTPGKSVNEDAVAAIIEPALRNLDVRAFAYDRWQFESLKKAFARRNWEPPFPEDFGQGFKTMTPALKAVESLALDGKLRHGNHPILRMCAENARVIVDDAGNRKLTKRRSTGRIDGMIALVMAIGAATAAPVASGSVYDHRDLLIL